jgi:predicted subunit of tRNA(5-methylaminomethyl-2-thiouridylate) methyltransferase
MKPILFSSNKISSIILLLLSLLISISLGVLNFGIDNSQSINHSSDKTIVQ